MTVTPARPVRVLLAAGQPMLRSGYRTALAAAPDLDVVGEAGDGVAALELARRLLPDVVLLGLPLPRRDGVAVVRSITEARLPVRVLMLADAETELLQSLLAGAGGFLAPDTTATDLAAAVRTVAAGGAAVAPDLLRRLLDRLAAADVPRELAPAPGPALAALTDREREVLFHLARGESNGEIAQALSVSETTVKTHVGNLLTKLELRDRVQAVVLAYEYGLVRPGASRPGWLP